MPEQPPPLVVTEGAIAQWLTSSAEHPEIAREHWRYNRPAILRTGGAYDAVRMPLELIHAAAESTTADIVAGVLAEILDGPVICHPGHWYYALVPPGTCEEWRSPMAAVRGRGGWLGVPRPDRTDPDSTEAGPYWAVPVEQPGRVCDPDAVAELLQVGRARIEGVAP